MNSFTFPEKPTGETPVVMVLPGQETFMRVSGDIRRFSGGHVCYLTLGQATAVRDAMNEYELRLADEEIAAQRKEANALR